MSTGTGVISSLLHSIVDKSASNSNNDDEKPRILVTGGAGYIGTHTIVCLLEAGYDITVVDNLSNSQFESLNRVKQLLDLPNDSKRLEYYEIDICDYTKFENEIFKQNSKPFQACIHFAGLKAVGESVVKPLLYYENNLVSTINLLKLMDKYDCHSIVFSSSATVYGSAEVPITEDTPVGLGITNPYGRTKYMIEEILQDFKKSKDINKDNDKWSIVILRYFNPVGAHPSGRIGEDPNGIPNNLMPFVSQVAVGRRPKLSIFGNDYPTPDGTGVRDFIHVMDLAEGHVAAIKYIQPIDKINRGLSKYDDYTLGEGHGKLSIFNLGTGKGCSVLDMVRAMESASGKEISYEVVPRREGDIAVCYADTTKAKEVLHWSATRSLQDMCTDLWSWQSNNPDGYKN
eukprot:gene17901-23519_t